MRVAVDATPCFNVRGYGRYARELLATMAELATGDEFCCLVDTRDAARLPFGGANVRVQGVRLTARPTEAASAGGSRSPLDMLRMSRAAHAVRADVLLYPTVYTFFPAPPGTPAVVTVHDTIVESFPELTLPSRRERLFWRCKVALALRQARIVLTVSDYSAREIERVLGVKRSRLRVTGEGVSAEYRPGAGEMEIAAARARVGLPDGARYLTFVGGMNPHKNLGMLVRAHARLAAELGDVAPWLVLVGPGAEDVFHQGASLDTGARVLRPGFLPDEELRALHSGSLALVLPSRLEGFGLPAVEAAACGSPVVATTASPLPELLAGGGIFVDPDDFDGWVNALRRVATDEPLRLALAHRATECAAALSWRDAATRALDALREAAT